MHGSFHATITLTTHDVAYNLFERLENAGVLGLNQALWDGRFCAIKMSIPMATADGVTARLTTAGITGTNAVDNTGASPNSGFEFGNEAAGGTAAAATPALMRTFELSFERNMLSAKELWLSSAQDATLVQVSFWIL